MDNPGCRHIPPPPPPQMVARTHVTRTETKNETRTLLSTGVPKKATRRHVRRMPATQHTRLTLLKTSAAMTRPRPPLAPSANMLMVSTSSGAATASTAASPASTVVNGYVDSRMARKWLILGRFTYCYAAVCAVQTCALSVCQREKGWVGSACKVMEQVGLWVGVSKTVWTTVGSLNAQVRVKTCRIKRSIFIQRWSWGSGAGLWPEQWTTLRIRMEIHSRIVGRLRKSE
jgi:hypothetical protein